MSFDIRFAQRYSKRFELGNETAILDQVSDKEFRGCITGYESLSQATAPKLLKLAAGFSEAPVSGFHVGAVAIGGTGRLYLGANMEFVGVPLSTSLHAEQSAVLNAWFHGETRIESIVVTAAPCGHCRQFMWELPDAPKMQVRFCGETHSLDALLPSAFNDLDTDGQTLLESRAFKLEPIFSDQTDLAKQAIRAASYSYTPYSKSPEGVSIECVDGNIFTGRTAESAAFNPTVTAIVCALNQRNFSHSRRDAISAVVHAKMPTSIVGQRDLTKSLIGRISNVTVQAVAIEMS
ncbi:MAG: cytidine deaminase [Opitutaceae bacterium]